MEWTVHIHLQADHTGRLVSDWLQISIMFAIGGMSWFTLCDVQNLHFDQGFPKWLASILKFITTHANICTGSYYSVFFSSVSWWVLKCWPATLGTLWPKYRGEMETDKTNRDQMKLGIRDERQFDILVLYANVLFAFSAKKLQDGASKNCKWRNRLCINSLKC